MAAVVAGSVVVGAAAGPPAVTARPAWLPWLSHLRVDRRGLPVPYVNRWGPERITVGFDSNVGRDAAFVDDAAELVPDFTRQNLGRQRACMVQGLCQVCGRAVPWSRRNLVVAALSVEWVPVGGVVRPVVFEPWLDDRCAAIATGWCPALIRRRRDEALAVVPVRSRREVQLVVSVGSVDGRPETVAAPVAMWVKAALLSQGIARGGGG